MTLALNSGTRSFTLRAKYTGCILQYRIEDFLEVPDPSKSIGYPLHQGL